VTASEEAAVLASMRDGLISLQDALRLLGVRLSVSHR
jgi:hypothetical protein